ncbi:MAG: Tim44/TimA family putative adaptor protein [Pseudomonadota bacterium]
MIEFIVLAAIAVFIGWRLYTALGQDDGPPDGRSRAPTPQPSPAPDATAKPQTGQGELRPAFTGPAAAGLEAIYQADKSFDPKTFVAGARQAYEMLVTAFGKGDKDTLKPYLDTDVFEAWDTAISEREASGGEGMELLRLRSADIDDASLADDGMARVTVKFEAELGDGQQTVKAKELWTFMRQTKSKDPNWLLDDVDTVD